MLFRKKENSELLKSFLDELREYRKSYGELVIELEKLRAKVEALEDKYNVLRASLGSLKASRKKSVEEILIENLAKSDPQKLEELGYRVIKINRDPQQSDKSKTEYSK